MNNALITALENRLELGEDKDSLRAEVLAAGHGEAVFESAYRIACMQVADKKAAVEESAQSADVPPAPEKQVPTNSTPPAPTNYDLKINKKTPAIKTRMLFFIKWLGVILLIGCIGFGVYYFVTHRTVDQPTAVVEEVDDTEVKLEALAIKNVQLIRTQAESYWSDNVSYAGVCSDPKGAYDVLRNTYDLEIGDVHCADDRGWYLVEVELFDGEYYCIDSEGTAIQSDVSRKGEETCIML